MKTFRLENRIYGDWNSILKYDDNNSEKEKYKIMIYSNTKDYYTAYNTRSKRNKAFKKILKQVI